MMGHAWRKPTKHGSITKMSSHQRHNDTGYMWLDTEFSLRGAWPSALSRAIVIVCRDQKTELSTSNFNKAHVHFLRREG